MAPAAVLTREALTAMILSCPYHRLLGVELVEMDAEAGTLRLAAEVKPEFSRSDHRRELHGGVTASLLDLAGDYAVALKTGHAVPTIGLSVDYLRMARGARAIASARVVKAGRSIAVVDLELTDETGALVAVGRGTYSTATG